MDRPPEQTTTGTGSRDRLRRGAAALAAGGAALVLQGDTGALQLGVGLATGLLVFEAGGRLARRWSPSKDPADYR